MLTFHRIIAGCEQGNAEAWRAFVSDYTPLAFELIRIYSPGEAQPSRLWQGVLDSLCADDFKLLRSFEHNSELEFLLDLRSQLFETIAQAQNSGGAAGEVTPERVRGILAGAPLLHQEILFLKLAGYSDARLEELFRVTPGVAKKSLEQLASHHWPALDSAADVCPYPAGWMALQTGLRAARTDACLPARQFIRIQDGQLGWYEKDPAERHVSECLRCLESWTALKEIAYWRRAARAASAEEIDRFFAALPLSAQPEKPRQFFKKIFG